MESFIGFMALSCGMGLSCIFVHLLWWVDNHRKLVVNRQESERMSVADYLEDGADYIMDACDEECEDCDFRHECECCQVQQIGEWENEHDGE